MHTETEINKYEFIDSLRGFAILAVLLTHAALISVPSFAFLRLVSENGTRGVQLFYVASALTLFLSMESRRRSESHAVRNFFIRRFFRIAPLFYLAIGLYTLMYGLGPREYAPNGIQAWQFPLTLLFLNGWHPEAINSIVPIEWSVAIEMTFYLCIPLLFAWLKDLESTSLFIIGSLILEYALAAWLTPVLLLHYTDQSRLVRSFLFFWFFSQLPVFGIGIATYHIFRTTKHLKDRKLGLTLLTGAVFLFVAGLNVKTFLGLLPQHVFYALAFLMFALALHYHPTRILVNPFTRWVGRVSYSLYLLHFLVVELIMRALPAPWPMGKTTAFFLAFLLITGLSLPVAGLSYRFIEMPGMNFGKRLIHNLEQPAAPQTAS